MAQAVTSFLNKLVAGGVAVAAGGAVVTECLYNGYYICFYFTHYKKEKLFKFYLYS